MVSNSILPLGLWMPTMTGMQWCQCPAGWILGFPSKDWLLKGTVMRTDILGNPINQCGKHFDTQRQELVMAGISFKSSFLKKRC